MNTEKTENTIEHRSMFILKKIIAPFLMPPGVFILLLLSYGGWLRYGGKRRGWPAPVLFACVLWLFSISPVAGGMMRYLESDFYHCKVPKGDAIILLGGGVVRKAPDLTGSGFPTDVMLGRIVVAVRLQKSLDIPIVVTGGRHFEDQQAEASVARRVMMDLGVPENRIIVEDNAADTMENARYTRDICLQQDFRRPILVTSACHMKRSLLSFEKAGLDVAPYPAGFKTSPDDGFHWENLFPNGGNLSLASMAMHEYLGLLFYKFYY